MFRATMCPSSGADDCIMPRVGMCRGCREVVKTGWQVAALRTHPWTHYLPTGLDNLPAATAHTNTRL
jgi:hypothetical protein